MSDLVTSSLEAVAARVGDPAPLVYARLFQTFPETEALFWGDTNGALRGEMLAMAFHCLLNLDGAYGSNMIRAERSRHAGFDVPIEQFGSFFPIVRDVCREVLAEAWTPEIDAAWTAALRRIAQLTPIGA